MFKEKALYQISLKVLLRNTKGEILLLKALDGGVFHGFYDLPGGRIDVDELALDTEAILKRELLEEIGNIDFKLYPSPVSIVRHTFTKPHKEISVLYIFFEADYLSGDVKISDEHSDHLWIKLDSIEPKEYFANFLVSGVEMYLKKK